MPFSHFERVDSMKAGEKRLPKYSESKTYTHTRTGSPRTWLVWTTGLRTTLWQSSKIPMHHFITFFRSFPTFRFSHCFVHFFWIVTVCCCCLPFVSLYVCAAECYGLNNFKFLSLPCACTYQIAIFLALSKIVKTIEKRNWALEATTMWRGIFSSFFASLLPVAIIC